MIQFELVAPERRLASMEADEVVIPAANGEMTAKPNHAPVMTLLRPGFLRVVSGGQSTDYAVTGGFAEVSPDAVSVLAEDAMEAHLLTAEEISERLAQAEAAAEAADAPSKAALEAFALELKNLRLTLNA